MSEEYDEVRTIGNDNDEDPYEQAVRQAEIDNKFFEEEARREKLECEEAGLKPRTAGESRPPS